MKKGQMGTRSREPGSEQVTGQIVGNNLCEGVGGVPCLKLRCNEILKENCFKKNQKHARE